jgi:hypothetical protein
MRRWVMTRRQASGVPVLSHGRLAGLHLPRRAPEPIPGPGGKQIEPAPYGILEHAVELWPLLAPLGSEDALVLVDRHHRPAPLPG